MKSAKSNLRLVAIESIATAGILSMPIMTPFFNSIGLNMEQIAISQAIFTIVLMFLNIPAGWIADRFSRKWANIIGDFGIGITMLLYSSVNDFTGVIIYETLFGVFIALSQGVDKSLIKHFTNQIKSETKFFEKTNANITHWQFISTFIIQLIGGPIGAIDLRLAIALSSVNFFVGGVISIFIKDDSENLKQVHKNPLKDMSHVCKNALANSQLRLRIFAYAISHELTHGLVWIFTPLMLTVNVPIAIVSLGWIFNSIAGIVGAKIASKTVGKKVSLKEWQLFAIPVLLTIISMSVIYINLNIITIWFYLLMGVVYGWSKTVMPSIVQNHIKPSEQTSIMSLASVISSLVYVPSIWFIGFMANIKIEFGLLAVLIFFIPPSIPIIIKLKREQ